MLVVNVRGAILGEGGYQEFPLTPERDWLPVVVALVVGTVVGGAIVALILCRRRSPAASASQQEPGDPPR